MDKVDGIATSLNDSFGALLDLIYPPVCQACHQFEASASSVVCEKCWGKVVSLADVAKLGISEQLAEAEQSTGGAQAESFRVVSLGEYEGPLGEMIRLFKFGGYTDLGIELGALLIAVAGPAIERWRTDILIPAPLHPFSRKKRGFNQAEILSDILSDGLSVPARGDLLIKSRRTRSQSLLTFAERQENLVNAFSAHPSELKEKRVTLVDDVVTTGATMLELEHTLAEVGAVVVGAISLASAKSEVSESGAQQEAQGRA